MKPEKIILVRHGESEGNVDTEIYKTKPEYSVELTQKGKQQAQIVGNYLASFLGKNELVQFYNSPFWRTRQTFEIISKNFPFLKTYEDARLREQEWGHFRNGDNMSEIQKERDNYGHFYYRLNDGESCADVYDRVSDFLNTLHREFKKEKFPKNVIIVTHGMFMRLFLMRWFHMTVEDFELLRNPPNCGCFTLVLNKELNKYVLLDQPERYEKRLHPYQYKWNQV